MSRKLKTETIELIVNRYATGESCVKLANEYGVSPNAVCAYARYRSIKSPSAKSRDKSSSTRKYICNHSFFASIDTEGQSYWLGFITADGCVTALNELRIMLQAGDADHLRLFNEHIASTYPVKIITHHGGQYCLLNISSKELISDLASLGVVPKKTRKVRWPDFLKEDLLPHFLRGYFDGNGSWKITSAERHNPQIAFSLSSNIIFLEGVRKYLIEQCNLSSVKIYMHNSKVGSGELVYGGRLQAARISSFMYNNATVFLTRKRDRIEHFLSMFESPHRL